MDLEKQSFLESQILFHIGVVSGMNSLVTMLNEHGVSVNDAFMNSLNKKVEEISEGQKKRFEELSSLV